MIADVCDAINTEMKKLGYTEAETEETLRDRRYLLAFDTLETNQEDRGGLGSQVVRVSRTVHVRVQYPESRTNKRWRRTIAEAQETIAVALYEMSTTGANQRFVEATIEEDERGGIGDVAIEFLGQIT
tara:strand:- start:2464 stop:2847 length:384 start_codon:yes stop_codon:yes gene_type:complete